MRWLRLALFCALLAIPASAQEWKTTTSGVGGTCGTLGGDLSGTCTSATVTQISGQAVGTAWSSLSTDQTSTTCQGGSITAAVITWRYKIVQSMKTLFFSLNLAVSNIGTCTGFITVTLPGSVTTGAGPDIFQAVGFDATSAVVVPNFGCPASSTTCNLQPTQVAAHTYRVTGFVEIQ